MTDSEVLRAALERLVSGAATEQDRVVVRRALLAGSIAYAAGEVGGDGGDAKGTIIITWEQGRIKFDLAAPEYEALRESIFPTPRGIPPPFPDLLFVGRADALRDVKHLLGADGGSPARAPAVVVRGWPGVGKTTLASVLSRDPDVAKTYSDGVLWTSLSQNPALMSILAGWGRAVGRDDLLGVPTPEGAVTQLAAALRQKSMLLIVDDVWEAEHAALFRRAMGDGCGLLITTRLPRVADSLGLDERFIYTLPVLAEEDALRLLRILAPASVEQHPDDCAELARDLEYLPLALHVTARLLRKGDRQGLSVPDLLREVRAGAAVLEAGAPVGRAGRATPPPVESLLRKSTDALDEHTRECFAYLGAFAPKPATFDLEAMKAVWQVDEPAPVVRRLVEHGLLEPLGGGRFRMHALLVMHARSLLVD